MDRGHSRPAIQVLRNHALLGCPLSRIFDRNALGEIGRLSTLIPNGRKASSTADAIAAGAPIRPPSPPPLIPNSVKGDGVSTWPARTSAGSSKGVGIK